MPVAVIVSGKLLSQRFKLDVGDAQLLRIPIFGLLVIQAGGAEVILGFSGFLLTLFFLAVLAGKTVYALFCYQFGVDPGQFNALCVFSSFATVVWSVLLYLLTVSRTGVLDSVKKEHDALIQALSKHDTK